MSASDANQYDCSPEQALADDSIREVWERVIKASGRPADKYEPVLPGILALTAGEKETPADTGRRKSVAAEYNVYDDISQSIYGIESDQAEEQSLCLEQSLEHLRSPGSRPHYNGSVNPQAEASPRLPANRPEEPSPRLETQIAELIHKQLEQSAFCRALAGYAHSRRAQRVLSLIANRDYSAARSLASLLMSEFGYYHLPGISVQPKEVGLYRPAIREARKNEALLTADCATVSEKTENVPVIKALLNAAGWHAENAAELKRLIGQDADFG
jgi:hypothetical protein